MERRGDAYALRTSSSDTLVLKLWGAPPCWAELSQCIMVPWVLGRQRETALEDGTMHTLSSRLDL